MSFVAIEREIPSVSPEPVFEVGGFPIANSFLDIFLITLIFALIAFFVIRKFSVEKPSKIQCAFEMTYEWLISLVESIVGSKYHAEKIFPLIATLIVYIGFANLFGLVPGITSFTYKGVEMFRTPMSDFNTTFGLAFAMVFLLQLVSIKEWGFWSYLGRFFQFKNVFMEFRKGIRAGMMAIVEFLIGLLDIVSEFAKIFSLSIRLFGNVYAGEVLAIILLGAVAYVVPSLWMAMSLLFGAIQALVFGSLVAAYYGFSIKPENEELLEE